MFLDAFMYCERRAPLRFPIEYSFSFSFSSSSSSLMFCAAALATAFCCFIGLWIVQSSSIVSILWKFRSKKPRSWSKKKSCGCVCSCGGIGGDFRAVSCLPPYVNGDVGEHMEGMSVVADWDEGASMMEQLVPEIRTHTLSYLDYPSLCRLSMTNSSMRKAANEDGAWKALYHKDFTLEQDSVTPPNGWKAYYAATRAVMNVNAEFYRIIKERSLPAMSRFWLPADYVKCVHGSGEIFSGFDSVMQSWQLAFDWGQAIAFQVQDVRARVLSDVAWVTMNTFVDVDTGPFNVTNVYEFHDGRWYMVHHHSSMILIDVELDH